MGGASRRSWLHDLRAIWLERTGAALSTPGPRRSGRYSRHGIRTLLGLGLAAFIATGIDDLLRLVVRFANRRLSARQVIVRQYLGFLALLALSVACSLLAIVIPAPWLGLLGIWPVLVGLQRLR